MPEAVPFVLMLFSRGAIPLPLTIMQILSIDLGTDMVPAMGLGTEKPEPGTMMRPPRSQNEPMLSSKFFAKALLFYGIVQSVTSMAAFYFMYWQNGWRPGLPMAGEGTRLYQMATTRVNARLRQPSSPKILRQSQHVAKPIRQTAPPHRRQASFYLVHRISSIAHYKRRRLDHRFAGRRGSLERIPVYRNTRRSYRPDQSCRRNSRLGRHPER